MEGTRRTVRRVSSCARASSAHTYASSPSRRGRGRAARGRREGVPTSRRSRTTGRSVGRWLLIGYVHGGHPRAIHAPGKKPMEARSPTTAGPPCQSRRASADRRRHLLGPDARAKRDCQMYDAERGRDERHFGGCRSSRFSVVSYAQVGEFDEARTRRRGRGELTNSARWSNGCRLLRNRALGHRAARRRPRRSRGDASARSASSSSERRTSRSARASRAASLPRRSTDRDGSDDAEQWAAISASECSDDDDQSAQLVLARRGEAPRAAGELSDARAGGRELYGCRQTDGSESARHTARPGCRVCGWRTRAMRGGVRGAIELFERKGNSLRRKPVACCDVEVPA